MAILERGHAASDSQPENQPGTHSQPPHDGTSWRGRLGYIVLGLASLVWLGLRSGTRPSRLVYPCQRVAAANGLGVLAYIASLIASTQLYCRAREHLTLGRLALLSTGLIMMTLLQGEVTRPALLGASPTLPGWTSPNAVSDVFAVTNVPTPTVGLDGGTIPGGISPAEALHDDGVDALSNLMATHGLKFYKTAQQPEGIVGQDDVVLISVYVLLPHLTPGSDAARDADARYHGGEFRRLLMTNENRARSTGMTDIVDLDDSLTVDEEQAQFNVFVADASAPPDVTLSLTAEPTSRAIQIGQTAVYTLSPAINGGYIRPVTLTLSGAPPETIVSFDPNPVIPPGTSHLYITTTASTVTGTYAMIVTGTSRVLTDTANLILTVAPATPSFTLSISPTTCIAKPNQIVSYTVAVTGVNGFSQPVILTVIGLPTGIDAAWSINPVTPDNSSILTLSIPSSPPFGDHPFQIVGTTETLTVTERVELIVDYPFKSYLSIILK